MKNVFVVGLDDFNHRLLRTIRGADDEICFHSLLSFQEVVRAETYEVESWVDRAREQIEAFGEPVDAIVSYWDFPSSVMRPLLREIVGLGGPSLESILRCEHKVWARREQKACVPDHTPGFSIFDPRDQDPWSQIDIEPPFWIKPVKAHSSHLGFYVRDRRAFDEAIDVIRRKAGRFAEPFDWVLRQAEGLPEDLRAMGGHAFIAEEIISKGRQCTLEGYTWRGEPRVYGVVDSIREGLHGSSFGRYQYPSEIPKTVQGRMEEIARTFIAHVGLDRTDWNAEFYWSEETDALHILEVNTRCSQSHAPLFWHVDGRAHFQVMVDLGLGREPRMPRGEGRHATAAKFMVRVHEDDGIVRRVPDEEDLRRVRQLAPDTLVKVAVEEGTRLSNMQHQDSYSYEIATVFMGAHGTEELEDHYERALGILDFEIDPVPEDGGGEAAEEA